MLRIQQEKVDHILTRIYLPKTPSSKTWHSKARWKGLKSWKKRIKGSFHIRGKWELKFNRKQKFRSCPCRSLQSTILQGDFPSKRTQVESHKNQDLLSTKPASKQAWQVKLWQVRICTYSEAHQSIVTRKWRFRKICRILKSGTSSSKISRKTQNKSWIWSQFRVKNQKQDGWKHFASLINWIHKSTCRKDKHHNQDYGSIPKE